MLSTPNACMAFASQLRHSPRMPISKWGKIGSGGLEEQGIEDQFGRAWQNHHHDPEK